MKNSEGRVLFDMSFNKILVRFWFGKINKEPQVLFLFHPKKDDFYEYLWVKFFFIEVKIYE